MMRRATPSPKRRTVLTPLLAPGRAGAFLAATLGLIGHQVGETLVPVVIGLVVDRAIAPSDPVALLWTLAVLALVFTWLSLSWQFGEVGITRVYEGVALQMRRGVIARILDPLGIRQRRLSGDLLSVGTNDVGRASEVAENLSLMLAQFAAVVTAAVSLLLISPELGVIVLVGVPLLLLIMHGITGPFERRSESEQEAAAAVSATASDLLSGLRTIKGLHAEAEASARHQASNERSLRSAIRAVDAAAVYQGISTLLGGLFLAGLAWLAGWFALEGRITVGQLVAVIGLGQLLQWPMAHLAFAWAWFARVRASVTRVAELETAPARVAQARRSPPNGTGAVVVRGVSGEALHELDLELAPGEWLGVLADSAEAGEELSRILAGAIGPDGVSGTVLIGDVVIDRPPLSDAPLDLLSVPHHSAVFSGTLRENVAPEVSDGELAELESALQLTDLRRSRDAGWDGEVGERGLGLSGGQRQRLALARAVAAHPQVLVLHEPTTSVDSVTEAAIADGLRRVRAGLGTIVITSSPALLAVCDRVVLLQSGRIAASGSHHELLGSNGAYRGRFIR